MSLTLAETAGAAHPGTGSPGLPIAFPHIGTPTRPVKTHEKSPGWQATSVDTFSDARALSNEYEWRNIAYHLIEAGRAETLRRLLLVLSHHGFDA